MAVFGSAGDDEVRVCIPKSREIIKVEKIGPCGYFLQQGFQWNHRSIQHQRRDSTS